MNRWLSRHLWNRLLPALALAATLAAAVSFVTAETINPLNDGSKFAYGENVGWINAEPLGNGGQGVTVSGTKLTGYMYGENIGWINMNCTNNSSTCATTGNYGVTNNGFGVLAGYAYGENVGWISFSCANDNTCGTASYGVTIDPLTGIFSGYAYGENIGWIHFSSTTPVAFKVQTSDDGDGIAQASDNCPFDANPGQENTTKSIDNGAGVVTDDVTVPNSHLTGDACSLDADGDGLPDAKELSATGCGAFDLSTTTHPNPAKNDITNDDNHNGNPAPPMGTDGADNGPSSDTDNDGVLDGAECILGTNPRSAASKPTATQCADLAQPTPGVGPNTATTDADGDGLPAAWEYCKWGTSDTKTDTDGDAKGDCKEAADVDGNGVVNFAGDSLATAKASQGVIGKTQDFDLNGDGLVNFAGDALASAKRAQAVTPCL